MLLMSPKSAMQREFTSLTLRQERVVTEWKFEKDADINMRTLQMIARTRMGKEKIGFSGRMGNRIAAPRLLKLTPLDSHLAGKTSFRGAIFMGPFSYDWSPSLCFEPCSP
ncbi:hypothetical protein HPP92_016564 [Vanilla planifolia]|uniref:Uncharacterized protein n=1 Tax=Vanilla planifolia TaxID=51239 RepID=A0A835QIC0_VANPL|nr:hypothetical protein HPP92_016564 [Vanilla planifolia]